MDLQEIEKLIKDVSDHYKFNIGENFAKAANRLVADLPWDEQKKELLFIIGQVIDIKLKV